MDPQLEDQLDALLQWEILEREELSPIEGWSTAQVEKAARVLLQWLRYAAANFDYDTSRRWNDQVCVLVREILEHGYLQDIMHLEERCLVADDSALCRLAGEYVSENRTARSRARIHVYLAPKST